MFTNKKIMMLCTTDNMIWQFLLPHIKFLQEQGNTVECVCARTGFWFNELKDKFGLKMHEIAFKRKPINLANFKAYRKLVKLQKQEKFDLVYCQQPVGGLMGRLISKKFKIPCIYTAHGFFFFKGNSKIKNFIYRTVEKFLARYTDILITINQEDYEAAKNWKAKHIYKINGIGMYDTKYETSTFNKTEFKESLGIQQNDRVIITVSEFIKRKNYKTMLKSIAELKKVEPNIKFLACGTGVQLEEMKQFAKDLGIVNEVQFMGYRKDINKILQISNVFYHQSYHEGLTMSIMEAMYYGLPAVVSNVRGNQDLIDNNKGGILTSCEDVTAQVDALRKLLNNPELCKQMGEYNKEKVKEFYLENVLKQLENIYNDLRI